MRLKRYGSLGIVKHLGNLCESATMFVADGCSIFLRTVAYVYMSVVLRSGVFSFVRIKFVVIIV